MFQIVNITTAAPKYQDRQLIRQPVDITFTVKGSRGYQLGSEVSNALMKLTTVEFSYYMGFPVLQIAERESSSLVFLCFLCVCFISHQLWSLFLIFPAFSFTLPTAFHYPELNTSHVLRSSWVRTGITASALCMKSCHCNQTSDPLCWFLAYFLIWVRLFSLSNLCLQCSWVCWTRKWVRGHSKPTWSAGLPCYWERRWDWSDVLRELLQLETAVFRYLIALPCFANITKRWLSSFFQHLVWATGDYMR